MGNFVVTFGQKDRKRRDGWVLIRNAKNLDQAQAFAMKQYREEFAFLYKEEDFTEGYFPQGCIEEFDLEFWCDFVG